MDEVSSRLIIGVAARYAGQIRELLALNNTRPNAPRAVEASKMSGDDKQARVSARQKAGVDLRA